MSARTKAFWGTGKRKCAIARVRLAAGNGEVVVKDGALTRVNETALLDELRSYLPEFQKHHTQVEALNRAFEPYFAQIHQRCCEQDVGINRYSSSESEWRW